MICSIGQCGLVTFLLISSSSTWICLVLCSWRCLSKRFLVVSSRDSCTRSSLSMTANLQEHRAATDTRSLQLIKALSCCCWLTLPSAGSVFPLPATEVSSAAPLPSAAEPVFATPQVWIGATSLPLIDKTDKHWPPVHDTLPLQLAVAQSPHARPTAPACRPTNPDGWSFHGHHKFLLGFHTRLSLSHLFNVVVSPLAEILHLLHPYPLLLLGVVFH